ncbi:DALR anticodon-binding domain-containing protein [Terracoccus luteus]|uniref:Arginyl-tRNA synthetase n=1 Tax=Terracoccus luteus TaxID=53356 RepID=A0A839PRG4_9MICO|nr:DALR anticodon-binding domain-containing protein [Terracoccus luteus]MBB2985404.1 arginyl-tRNA synthetase [Terracoccus luteus]MCP2171056.1 arginyl-tRNA synthetase [Terracoccus luteus]
MTPERLRALLDDVAAEAVAQDRLPAEAADGAPAGPLFRPVLPRGEGEVADWVTPVAQRWSRALSLTPRELARVLAAGLVARPEVAAVEVAPSGLVTLTVTDEARGQVVAAVLADPTGYARGMPSGAVPPAASPPGSPPTSTPDPSVSDRLAPARRAHARLRRLVRNAEAVGVYQRGQGARDRLADVAERLLLVALADLPQRLAAHEGDRARQERALLDLAGLADAWHLPLRPRTVDDPDERVHGVRLGLARAASLVLRNGLHRLGADAPERM